MNDPRLARIMSLLAAAGPSASTAGLCSLAAAAVGVAGAGVMEEGVDQRAPLCSSGAAAARILDLCFTLGEGPGRDAHRDGAPVAEPDLAAPRQTRWPSFGPPAPDRDTTTGHRCWWEKPERATLNLALVPHECQRRPCLVSDVEAPELAARLEPRRSR